MTGEAAAAAVVPTSPPPLSADDLSFFVREGYLIKRGVLDPSQCAAARDALWAANASSVLRRDAPDSWRPIAADDESTDMMNYRKGDQWRLRGMCSTSLVLDMFPRRINSWFEQLLGADEVVQPFEGSRRGWNNWGGYETRGVYCVLPTASAEAAAAAETDRSAELARGLGSAHVDPQPSHMVVACYIDEVPEGGGGFCIFPRSHVELYARDPGFADMGAASFNYPDEERAVAHGAPAEQVAFVGNPRFKPCLSDAYTETRRHVTSTIKPLQIAGSEGDVILTHGRTFHMGSRNLSDKIRQAMFYDVVKKEVDAKFSAQPDDQGNPSRAHADDMWHDWSAEVRAAVARESGAEAGALWRAGASTLSSAKL